MISTALAAWIAAPLALGWAKRSPAGRAELTRLIAACLTMICLALPLRAGPDPVDTLIEALALGDILEIMRQEGLDYGEDLRAEMFPGRGGGAWPATVARIYDGARIRQVMRDSLAEELDETDLAPLIDPNLHSCGTVRPHGVVELAHPEKDFYIVGMKSYGRAPTFLMTTGYEQVRSVVAELAGDPTAAREVRLKLPETGVCKTGPALSAAARGLGEAEASRCCA